jgi:hypothetical protein
VNKEKEVGNGFLEIDVFNGFADTAFDDYLWLCLFPKGS